MIRIIINEQIKNRCPNLYLGIIECKVTNSKFSEELWEEIFKVCTDIKQRFPIDKINKRPTIQATREAYKKTGKDPNRYRPSAEALCRRIVKGLPLYKINTLVDLINLISIKSGYSIGGFDSNKIEGEKLILGIGSNDDVFEGIGRGILNIEGMPVYRDSIGGIGTPTSDNERTKLTLQSSKLLMIINGYAGLKGLNDTIKFSSEYLIKYTLATDIQSDIIH